MALQIQSMARTHLRPTLAVSAHRPRPSASPCAHIFTSKRCTAVVVHASAEVESMDEVPPGCARYSVTLNKPLGLVLEENKQAGTIVVAEVLAGGNADTAGLIGVGDQLIATSGYTRTTEQTYGEIVVRGGEKVVRLQVRGETFNTVMAAISSHPATVPVKLEFQRC